LSRRGQGGRWWPHLDGPVLDLTAIGRRLTWTVSVVSKRVLIARRLRRSFETQSPAHVCRRARAGNAGSHLGRGRMGFGAPASGLVQTRWCSAHYPPRSCWMNPFADSRPNFRRGRGPYPVLTGGEWDSSRWNVADDAKSYLMAVRFPAPPREAHEPRSGKFRVLGGRI